MDQTVFGVLTGTDPTGGPTDLKIAVAVRAAHLIPNITKKSDHEHTGGLGFCYDGNRCKPENLGWRFEQSFGSVNPQEIADGKWDEQIESTYHNAADAEYWYRYEKDWGWDS